MRNLLIIIDQVLYLCINDGTQNPKVYAKRPNLTSFVIEHGKSSFEKLEERLLNKSLAVYHYEYTSASNPTELRELYPELFI